MEHFENPMDSIEYIVDTMRDKMTEADMELQDHAMMLRMEVWKSVAPLIDEHFRRYYQISNDYGKKEK